MGGLQNFLKQHKPGISKACQLNPQKKNSASAHQRSQPHLESFFTKEPKALIPPMIPTPLCVVAYAMEPTSSGPTRVPNVLVSNILTKLEDAIAKFPNIPKASETMSQLLDNPGNVHWEAVKHIFQYLSGTRSLELTFSGEHHDLVRYSDTDGTTQEHRRAISRHVFLIDSRAIS
jgi:hypothetical protein